MTTLWLQHALLPLIPPKSLPAGMIRPPLVGGPTDAAASVSLLGGGEAVRRLREQIRILAPHLRVAFLFSEAGMPQEPVARDLCRCQAPVNEPFIVFRQKVSRRDAASEETRPEEPSFGAAVHAADGGSLYIDRADQMDDSLKRMLLEQFSQRPAAPGRPRLLLGMRTIRGVTGSSFAGELLEDLAAVSLRIPSLAERTEDLPELAQALLRRMTSETGSGPVVMDAGATELLQQHTWPGNLDELAAVLGRALEAAMGTSLTALDVARGLAERAILPEKVSGRKLAVVRLQEVIHHHVREVLGECEGNKVRAAEMLGISRSTLYRMLDGGASLQ